MLILFTFTAGIRSSAFASIVKDALVIVVLVAVVATIGAATHLGGIGTIFHRLAVAHPDYATLPGMEPDAHHTALWFMSALLMTNVGYWMWPHSFQASLTARSERTIRRNAVLQPLYTLSYFFVFMIGFAALLTLPKLDDSNQALVAVIAHSYPAWFVGLAAGTAALVAVVPSTVMLLTVGTTLARNVYRPSAQLSDRHRLVTAAVEGLFWRFLRPHCWPCTRTRPSSRCCWWHTAASPRSRPGCSRRSCGDGSLRMAWPLARSSASSSLVSRPSKTGGPPSQPLRWGSSQSLSTQP